jgi:hypothetical protein
VVVAGDVLNRMIDFGCSFAPTGSETESCQQRRNRHQRLDIGRVWIDSLDNAPTSAILAWTQMPESGAPVALHSLSRCSLCDFGARIRDIAATTPARHAPRCWLCLPPRKTAHNSGGVEARCDHHGFSTTVPIIDDLVVEMANGASG